MQAKLAASRGAQLALNWRSEGAKPATDSRECTTDDDEAAAGGGGRREGEQRSEG